MVRNVQVLHRVSELCFVCTLLLEKTNLHELLSIIFIKLISSNFLKILLKKINQVNFCDLFYQAIKLLLWWSLAPPQALLNKRNEWCKVDVKTSCHITEKFNYAPIEVLCFWIIVCLVNFYNINHRVNNGCYILSVTLTENKTIHGPDNTNLEIYFFSLVTVILPSNHSDEKWDDQVEVVILWDLLQLLDHLKRALKNIHFHWNILLLNFCLVHIGCLLLWGWATCFGAVSLWVNQVEHFRKDEVHLWEIALVASNI